MPSRVETQQFMWIACETGGGVKMEGSSSLTLPGKRKSYPMKQENWCNIEVLKTLKRRRQNVHDCISKIILQ